MTWFQDLSAFRMTCYLISIVQTNILNHILIQQTTVDSTMSNWIGICIGNGIEKWIGNRQLIRQQNRQLNRQPAICKQQPAATFTVVRQRHSSEQLRQSRLWHRCSSIVERNYGRLSSERSNHHLAALCCAFNNIKPWSTEQISACYTSQVAVASAAELWFELFHHHTCSSDLSLQSWLVMLWHFWTIKMIISSENVL